VLGQHLDWVLAYDRKGSKQHTDKRGTLGTFPGTTSPPISCQWWLQW
jgi:hypothetical protein